jgi:hypothetical protein
MEPLGFLLPTPSDPRPGSSSLGTRETRFSPISGDLVKLSSLLRKLRSLNGEDRVALIPATLRLLTVRVALRILPFRTVLRWAERPVKEDQSPRHLAPGTLRRIRALERAGHGLFPKNPCLTQALAAHRLLRKKGQPSELRIGVRRTTERLLEAHAWVENRGEILIGERGLADGHVSFPSILPPTRPSSPPDRRDDIRQR